MTLRWSRCVRNGKPSLTSTQRRLFPRVDYAEWSPILRRRSHKRANSPGNGGLSAPWCGLHRKPRWPGHANWMLRRRVGDHRRLGTLEEVSAFIFPAAIAKSGTIFRRITGLMNEYRGVEYAIVQGIERGVWMVRVRGRHDRNGQRANPTGGGDRSREGYRSGARGTDRPAPPTRLTGGTSNDQRR